MAVYLWTEDRENKSGFLFWKMLMSCLYPEVIVESKMDNVGLVKAVQGLKYKNIENDRYIIAMDNSFDNDQVVREMRAMKNAIDNNHNICLLHLISFEYVLLSFDKLLDWIYAEEDEFRVTRATEIVAREALIKALDSQIEYKSISAIKYMVNDIDEYNIEQLTEKLLFRLTRNTGFEVSKGNLGECWRVACCNFSQREQDDMCGLESNRISLVNKAKIIFDNTLIKSEFQRLKMGGWAG